MDIVPQANLLVVVIDLVLLTDGQTSIAELPVTKHAGHFRHCMHACFVSLLVSVNQQSSHHDVINDVTALGYEQRPLIGRHSVSPCFHLRKKKNAHIKVFKYFLNSATVSIIRLHRMHEMQTIVADDCDVCPSVCHAAQLGCSMY